MDEYIITNFINEQIDDISRYLREIQINIQKEQTLSFLCLYLYLQSYVNFNIFLISSLEDVCENIRLDYIVFQKAKMNYELMQYYSEMLSSFSISIEFSKKMEEITRKDYSELVLIKEDGYNMNEFTTFIYRNAKRVEELSDEKK